MRTIEHVKVLFCGGGEADGGGPGWTRSRVDVLTPGWQVAGRSEREI